MKRSQKFAVGIVASLGLGLAVATAFAQPGPMDGGMGPGAMSGMQHGMKGGMGQGGMSHGAAGQMSGQQLMTPEEQIALREKMRTAATPEERQTLADATRTEMQKRAKEKGITFPQQRGPRAGFGPNSRPATDAHTH